MRPGQRLEKDGFEVCLFPMNHATCSRGWIDHGDRYPSDWYYVANTPVYAPFSGTVYVGDVNYNTIFFVSDSTVWTPSGLKIVTVSFSHSNDISPYPWYSGQHFNQGDLLYHTGTKGELPMGDHLHLDQAEGDRRTLAEFNTYVVQPQTIFYLSGDEEYIDQSTLQRYEGVTIPTWDGPIPPSGHFKWWMARKLLYQRRLKI